MLFALIVLALAFAFLNGFNDSSAIVAPVISTRAMPSRRALILTAVSQFIGPFIFGTAVAITIGQGLLRVAKLEPEVAVAALIGAVAWSLVTWGLGIPSSSTHALVGGLLGAAALWAGWSVVRVDGLIKILASLLLSPPLGLLFGFLVVRLTLWFTRQATPGVSETFRRLQVVTLVALGLSHGTSDAPKTMGVITLGLLAAGRLEAFAVPWWVKLISVAAFALGTSMGGWRQIRTLGGRIFRIRPVHGFSALAGGAAVVLGAGLSGGPISTSQVLASAIMGAGAGERVNQVRWLIARDMLTAWVLTIPAAAALAAAALEVLRRLGH